MSLKRQCRRCLRYRETASAQRFGGGSYKRAGRYYSSQICLECAKHLVGRSHPGDRQTSLWGISTLRRAIDELERRAQSEALTEIKKEGNNE